MEIEGADFGFRSIDARPSDAIAVALRLNTPILVSMDVIQEAGISEREVKHKVT
jgi:bifunctional DNase/RNase